MNRITTLILLNFAVFCIGILGVIKKNQQIEIQIIDQKTVNQYSPLPIEEKIDVNYEISDPVPAYKNYQETWDQLKEWNKQCPELVEIGTYGQSRRGTDLHWIKIENEHLNNDRPVVLITACIHGNEPLSASTVMGYIGTILNEYGDKEEITNLIDERIVYFVPVVSPDSYPHSRHVDGVDPNRDFPESHNPDKQSVAPVAAIQDLFNEIKPNAVISGHTWGRVYLTPYGDREKLCPNNDDYRRIIGEMCRMSQYRMQRASEMYNGPIYGTDVDWYYRNGAFSIVMEFGTHQRVPSKRDIDLEFNRTFNAVLYFIKEAPIVEIKKYSIKDWRHAA